MYLFSRILHKWKKKNHLIVEICKLYSYLFVPGGYLSLLGLAQRPDIFQVSVKYGQRLECAFEFLIVQLYYVTLCSLGSI